MCGVPGSVHVLRRETGGSEWPGCLRCSGYSPGWFGRWCCTGGWRSCARGQTLEWCRELPQAWNLARRRSLPQHDGRVRKTRQEQFGTVLSTRDPRILQPGGKLTFWVSRLGQSMTGTSASVRVILPGLASFNCATVECWIRPFDAAGVHWVWVFAVGRSSE